MVFSLCYWGINWHEPVLPPLVCAILSGLFSGAYIAFLLSVLLQNLEELDAAGAQTERIATSHRRRENKHPQLRHLARAHHASMSARRATHHGNRRPRNLGTRRSKKV
jgi:hypothetical protein